LKILTIFWDRRSHFKFTTSVIAAAVFPVKGGKIPFILKTDWKKVLLAGLSFDIFLAGNKAPTAVCILAFTCTWRALLSVFYTTLGTRHAYGSLYIPEVGSIFLMQYM
jgi:hypothetical protein